MVKFTTGRRRPPGGAATAALLVLAAISSLGIRTSFSTASMSWTSASPTISSGNDREPAQGGAATAAAEVAVAATVAAEAVAATAAAEAEAKSGPEPAEEHEMLGWCGGQMPSADKLMSTPSAPTVDIEALIPSYWRRLEATCPLEERQYRPCAARDPSQRSTANVTIEQFAFRGLGTWNTLTFATYTAGGQRKTQGGDSWVASLRDKTSDLRIPARVFDMGDGTYMLAFVPLRPGQYSLTLRMLYSLCAGYQEPFPEGIQQLKDKAEEAHCFLNAKAADIATLEVPELYHPGGCWARTAAAKGMGSGGSNAGQNPAAADDRRQPLPGRLLRSDYHLWRNGSYMMFERCCMPAPWRLAATPKPTRAIVWGDSTQRYPWHHMLMLARQPCAMKQWRPRHFLEGWGDEQWCPPAPPGQADPELEAALQRCTAGAPWTSVPVGTNFDGVSMYFPGSILHDMNNFVYNDTYARLALGDSPPKEFTYLYYVGYGCLESQHVLGMLPQINRTTDAVIFNMGPHCLGHITFIEWKARIDGIAAALAGMGSRVVWRTSFAMREDALRKGLPEISTFSSDLFFPTEARRQLFDSYAEHAMRSAGVPVWDISAYGLGGLHRPRDMQHLDGQGARTINLEMAEVLLC